MPTTVAPIIDAEWFTHTDQPMIAIDAELMLRPFTEDDAPAILRAFSTPDIQRWHTFRMDHIEQAKEWIARSSARWSAGTSADWAITDAAGVRGRCGLHIDCRHGTAEIAYWLLTDARGRGAMTHAVVAVTQWAHSTLGVHRVVLQHSTRNAASRAVAARSGYVPEGTARQQGLHADGWHDMEQHAHLATD